MIITGPRLTRRTCFLLGVLSLSGTYACADRVSAPPPSVPTAQLDLEATGVFVSTLWRPTDTGAAWIGGITGRLDVREAGPGVRVETADVRPFATAPARSALLADGTGAAPLKRLVATRTIDLPSHDGRRLRLRIASTTRGDGRPPIAVVVYQDDRPVAVNEYSYAKSTNGWRLARSRITTLDSTGKATLVVENEVDRALAAVAHGAAPDASGTVSRETEVGWDDGDYTDDGEGVRCGAEKLAVAAATANWIESLAKVAGLAVVTCTLVPPGCELAILAAQAALVKADIALGIAIGNLYNCLNNVPPPPPPPPSTGGGEPGGDGYEEWCEFEHTYVDGYLVETEIVRCWWVKQ